MAKAKRAVSAFSETSFVRAHAPSAIALSPADAQSGTLSIVRTVSGNFASGPFDLEIQVPPGFVFFPQAAGLVLTFTDTVGVVGQVRFGTPADRALYVPATTVEITEAFERQEWFIRDEELRRVGVRTLSAGLATSGILTQAIGYLYFVGLMVRR